MCKERQRHARFLRSESGVWDWTVLSLEGCAARWGSGARLAVCQNLALNLARPKTQLRTPALRYTQSWIADNLVNLQQKIFLPLERNLHLPPGKNPLLQPKESGLELERWLGEPGVRSKAERQPQKTFSQMCCGYWLPSDHSYFPTTPQFPSWDFSLLHCV